MASIPLFKDISKNANELLRKGYTSTDKYGFRIEGDGVTDAGIQFTPNLQVTLDKTVEGELKAKFPCKDHQITSTANMKNDVTFEISPSKHSSRGIKWTATLSSNLADFADKAKVKLGVELKKDYTMTSLTYEHPFKQGSAQKSEESKIALNTVFNLGETLKGVLFGFETDLAVSSMAFKNFNATLAYNKSDVDFSLFWKNKIGGASSVGANYVQKLNSDKWKDAQFGGEYSFDLNEKSSSLVVGTSFKPADSATLKARLDSKGLLGFVYTEKWSGPLSVTFGSDWNILGAANAAPFQYSIKLAFK